MVFGKLQHRSWERSINRQTGPRAPSSHGAGPKVPHSQHKCSSSCYLLLRFVWHLSFGRLLISSSVIQAIINKLRFEREGRSRGEGERKPHSKGRGHPEPGSFSERRPRGDGCASARPRGGGGGGGLQHCRRGAGVRAALAPGAAAPAPAPGSEPPPPGT